MHDAGSEVAYIGAFFPQAVSFATGWMMTLAYLIVCPYEAVAIPRVLTGLALTNLQDKNFDTGQPTRAGEYKLADDTYSKLVRQPASKNFENASPELRHNILAFYGNLDARIATKGHKEDWQETLHALDKLKATPTQAVRPTRRR